MELKEIIEILLEYGVSTINIDGKVVLYLNDFDLNNLRQFKIVKDVYNKKIILDFN